MSTGIFIYWTFNVVQFMDDEKRAATKGNHTRPISRNPNRVPRETILQGCCRGRRDSVVVLGEGAVEACSTYGVARGIDSRSVYGELAEKGVTLSNRELFRVQSPEPRTDYVSMFPWSGGGLETDLAVKQQLARDASLAHAYYVVGLVHNKTGHSREALPPFERALAIAEVYYGSQHPELEIYVREYGAALNGEGRY